MSRVTTRGTPERFAIRETINSRGKSLVLSFFANTVVTEDDVTRIYYGLPVDEAKFDIVKRVLKERLTHD